MVAVACVAIFVPHEWEGPVVLTLSDTHGVHVTDLIALAGAAIVVALIWRKRRG